MFHVELIIRTAPTLFHVEQLQAKVPRGTREELEEPYV